LLSRQWDDFAAITIPDSKTPSLPRPVAPSMARRPVALLAMAVPGLYRGPLTLIWGDVAEWLKATVC